jgi:hypothetical protein
MEVISFFFLSLTLFVSISLNSVLHKPGGQYQKSEIRVMNRKQIAKWQSQNDKQKKKRAPLMKCLGHPEDDPHSIQHMYVVCGAHSGLLKQNGLEDYYKFKFPCSTVHPTKKTLRNAVWNFDSKC